MKRCLAVLMLAAFAATLCAAQRLPGTVVPDHYQISLTPDLKSATFSGEETIDVRVLQPTSSLVLNSAEIKFEQTTVTAGGNTQSATVSTDEQKEFATLALEKPLPAGPAKIHIKFSGVLNDQLRGFYLSKTRRRNYAVTQFEATDARRAFPSFDEPAMKATFDVALVVDDGDTAISNEKIVSDTPGPGEGKHTIKFGTTPKMSSYLVAFEVGDFQCVDGSADNTPIRVCATPDKKDLGRFALQAAEHILSYFNNYYGIKYPFHKLDLVALPDFAAGAMENTGDITYRETLLLIDDQSATVGAHKAVVAVAAHEMAHQWFGDLVTAQWWDDIWLNEGFATWMTSKPIKAWKPEWRAEIDEVQGSAQSLGLDALQNTRPIHAATNEATTPAQIGQLFDGIAYGKTAAVLRMLESWLGEEPFRKGVNAYLQKHAYGNATAADFWNAMAAASKKPVDKVMPTWVEQAGAPMLTVKTSCNGGQTRLELSQARFFQDPALLAKGSPELWQIPVCARSGSGPVACELMTQKHDAMTLKGCGPWVFVNAGGHGYYRSNYSPEMADKLAANAENGLTPGERIMLLSDEWAMVRANQHQIGQFLGLVEGLRNDRVQQVVQTYAGGLSYIADRIAAGADRDAYRNWLRNLLRPMVTELGWKAKPGESDQTRELRTVALNLMGRAARDPETLRQATVVARQYMQDPASVDANVANIAIELSALQGDAQLYDEYLAHAKAAKTPEEHYRYIDALTFFPQKELAQRTLETALSPELRAQDLFRPIVGLMGNPETRQFAWDFMKAHWGDLQKKSAGGFSQGFGGLAGSFCSAEARQDMQQWFQQHPDPGSARSLRQGMERLNDCVRLKEQQGGKLSSWLKEHGNAAGE